MRYYKLIEDGYINAIGIGLDGEEITAEEYAQILGIIRSKPTAEIGFDYHLKEDLTWELCEVPVTDTSEEEAAIEDFQAALAEFGVKL